MEKIIGPCTFCLQYRTSNSSSQTAARSIYPPQHRSRGECYVHNSKWKYRGMTPFLEDKLPFKYRRMQCLSSSYVARNHSASSHYKISDHPRHRQRAHGFRSKTQICKLTAVKLTGLILQLMGRHPPGKKLEVGGTSTGK